MNELEYRRFVEDDAPRVAAMRQEAFRLPMVLPVWLEEGRVLADAGGVHASVQVPFLGAFYGGRRVATAGISAMVVAPEQRRHRLGWRLMASAFAEMRANGVGLSLLFPTSYGFYRSLGYEVAGTYTRYAIGCDCFRPPTEAIDAEPWDDAQLAEVADCYRSFAVNTNGLLDRTPSWWRHRVLAAPADQPVYRYRIVHDGRTVGYWIAQHQTEATGRSALLGQLGVYYSVVCRDLVWLDRHGANGLVALVSGHRTLGQRFAWTGAPDDELVLFAADPAVTAELTFAYMARIVDVQTALESRGYPPELDVAVQVRVHDPVIEENSHAFALEVSEGSARARRCEQAVDAPELDVGALAALYTGFMPARALARSGRLVGVTERQVATLEALFRGPRPWVMDRF